MLLQSTKWVSSFAFVWTVLDPFSISIILFQLFWCCDSHNTVLSSGTITRKFPEERALLRTGSTWMDKDRIHPTSCSEKYDSHVLYKRLWLLKCLQAISTISPCTFLYREAMMLWTGPGWKYWEAQSRSLHISLPTTKDLSWTCL